MIFSCSGYSVRSDRPRGVYHRVRSGETLSLIAKAYRVDLQEIAEVNNINNPDLIEKDSVIFIPAANQVMDDVMAAAKLVKQPSSMSGKTRTDAGTAQADSKQKLVQKDEKVHSIKAQEPPSIDVTSKHKKKTRGTTASQRVTKDAKGHKKVRFDRKRFAWPVRGKVVSKFGVQPNRMYYNGIRIEANGGTTVQAAADGIVIFSAPLKGYGETIIIQHEDQYATVYTHLGIRAVQEETRVNKGDRIAFLGDGGDLKKSFIDFEIRYKNKARNPLFLLP
jgi:lipoprotein NlpD